MPASTEYTQSSIDSRDADSDKSAVEKKLTIIFNPVSGQSDPEQRKAAISAALAEHGYLCDHLETTPERGARHLTEQAVREGVDLVAVSGGDGTVMEVMTALVGTSIPVAIFPAGTGNLLSLNLGLARDVPRAVEAALFGARRAIDLARVSSIDGEKNDNFYFAVMAGAGYDAWIIRDAGREAKKRLGLGAYLLAAVKNLKRRPVHVEISLDNGRRVIRARAKSVMIANMGRLQGNVDAVPDALPDDGLLDVAILKAETFNAWFRLVVSAIRRRLRDDPAVDYAQAQKIHVRLNKPQPMQFDGEDSPGRHRSFTVEVMPKAVEVMVPKL